MPAILTLQGVAVLVAVTFVLALGFVIIAGAIEASRHCRVCGQRLIHRTRLEGYSERNGKPTYSHFLACPDAPIGSRPEGFEDYAMCLPALLATDRE